MMEETLPLGQIEGIDEKIRTARLLCARHGEALRGNPRVRELMERLIRSVAVTRTVMVESGLVNECRRCEELEGGSCCGEGIENKYGIPLLVMNLLLDTELPDRRATEKSCLFLGPMGCILTARHVICVNYLCRKAENALTRQDLFKLQDASGEELETVFLLQEIIIKAISA